MHFILLQEVNKIFEMSTTSTGFVRKASTIYNYVLNSYTKNSNNLQHEHCKSYKDKLIYFGNDQCHWEFIVPKST
jgi:hypothetical protein